MISLRTKDQMDQARTWWEEKHGKENWKKWTADEYNCVLLPAYDARQTEEDTSS